MWPLYEVGKGRLADTTLTMNQIGKPKLEFQRCSLKGEAQENELAHTTPTSDFKGCGHYMKYKRANYHISKQHMSN